MDEMLGGIMTENIMRLVAGQERSEGWKCDGEMMVG